MNENPSPLDLLLISVSTSIEEARGKELSSLEKTFIVNALADKSLTFYEMAEKHKFSELSLRKAGSDIYKVLRKAWNEPAINKKNISDIAKKRLVYGADRNMENLLLDLIPKNNQNFIDHICDNFVGRMEEKKKALEYLNFDTRRPYTVISGIGGVGKTSLALEVALCCWKAKYLDAKEIPGYEAVVFTSFKKRELLSEFGIFSKSSFFSKRSDVFLNISRTISDGSITRSMTQEEQSYEVYECVKKQSTLLIIDDFESLDLDERKEIVSFLRNMPRSAQVACIITTRDSSNLDTSEAIEISSLTKDEGIAFINDQLSYRNIEYLSEKDKECLFECYSGIPLALRFAIGQLDRHLSAKTASILSGGCSATKQQIVNFCFANSIASLSDEASYELLKAISIFRSPPNEDALVYVSGLSSRLRDSYEGALTELCNKSLIRRFEDVNSYEINHCFRYEIDSLTSQYALSEAKKDPRQMRDMYERWLNWHKDVASTYGGTDWGDWRDRYDFIADEWTNFLSVLEWCAVQRRKDEFKVIWRKLNHFSDLYGYWRYRIECLDTLIEWTHKNGDWNDYVSFLSSKMWTLTMKMDKQSLQEAVKLFNDVKPYFEFQEVDYSTKDYFYHNATVLMTKLKKFTEARDLNATKASNLKEGIESGFFNHEENKSLKRRELNTIRNSAKIDFEEDLLDESKSKYEIVLNGSREINWKRMICYSKYMLAEIAIEEGEWKEAQQHLVSGYSIATYNKNIRRQAYYLYAQAKVYKGTGDKDDMIDAAERAIEKFKYLGMDEVVEEIKLSCM